MAAAAAPKRFAAWAIVLSLCLPLAATAQQAAPAAASAYSSAAALQDRGMYDLAANEWQALLADHPQDPLAARAHYNLGVCRFQSGDFAPAAEAFQQATTAPGGKAISDSSWANLGLARFNQAASLPAAQADAARGAYQAAVAALDKLLAEFPSSPQVGAAHFYRAESLTALGEHQQAAEGYRAVLANQAAAALHTAARLGLASAELESNQPQQAEATLNTLLAAKPQGETAGEAYRLRGEARLASQQYDQAAEDFALAAGVKDYSAASDALERGGFALYSAGKQQEAATLYLQLPKRFPNSPLAAGAQLAAGKCLVLAGKQQDAAFLLGGLWRASPTADNAEAAHWLVQTLVDAEQFDEAAQVAQQALATNPTDEWAAPLLMNRADALYELPPQRVRALQLYREIAQQHADTAQGERAAYLASHTALELGKHDLALQLAQDFLTRRSESQLTVDSRLVAAEAATRLSKPQEAAGQYGRLLQESPQDPRCGDWTLRLAVLYQQQGQWQELSDTLKPRVDSLSPRQQEQALGMLAESARQQGDQAAAERLLTRLISRGNGASHVAPALYQRGELLTAASRRDEANNDFAALAKRFPQHELAPFALYSLAANQLADHQTAAAESTLRRLLSQHNTGPLGKAKFLLSGLLQIKGQHAEALTLLDGAEAPPPDVLYLRGVCLAGTGNTKHAQAAFEQLLKQHPGHTSADRAAYELAWLVRETNPARAAERFARLASDYPNSPLAAEALLRAGELEYAQKSYDQAADALEQAAANKAASPDIRQQALHLLGWARFELGDFGGARDAFARQLQIDGQRQLAADAAAMSGECLFALERYAEALAAYQRTAQSSPRNKSLAALAWLHAAQAAGQVGKWEESLQWIDRASQADSDGAHADQLAYERGWALFNLRRLEEAEPIFQKLAAAGPNVLSARAQFMLGEIEFAEKQYEPAVRTFFRVAYGYGGRNAPVEYHPWQSESLFEAARCLELLGRVEPARKLYAELLERFPNSAKARQARSRLQPGTLR